MASRSTSHSCIIKDRNAALHLLMIPLRPQFPLSAQSDYRYLYLPPPGADAEGSAIAAPAQTGDRPGSTVWPRGGLVQMAQHTSGFRIPEVN